MRQRQLTGQSIDSRVPKGLGSGDDNSPYVNDGSVRTYSNTLTRISAGKSLSRGHSELDEFRRKLLERFLVGYRRELRDPGVCKYSGIHGSALIFRFMFRNFCLNLSLLTSAQGRQIQRRPTMTVESHGQFCSTIRWLW